MLKLRFRRFTLVAVKWSLKCYSIDDIFSGGPDGCDVG